MKGMKKPMLGIRRKLQGSIQLRLTCYFLFILLPLVGASLFALHQSQQILKRQIGERTSSAMKSTLDYIDITLRGIQETSTLLSSDVNLNETLQKVEEQLDPASILEFQRMSQYLLAVTNASKTIAQASILHIRSGLMVSSIFGPKHVPALGGVPWYEQVARSNGRPLWVIPGDDDSPVIPELQQAVRPGGLTLMRLMDLANPQRHGDILMLTIDREALQKLIADLAPSPRGSIYLLDEAERLVAGSGKPGEALAKVAVSDTFAIVSEDTGEKLLGLRVRSPLTGWSLLLVQPERDLFVQSQQLQVYIGIIIALSFVLALWISWVVYQGIASPINYLASGMKRMRMGRLDTRLDVIQHDELGYLIESFNQLAAEQRHLIRDNYEQQLRRSKTELKFLQSQIHPHFLYNTLDSIYWSAKDYGADELSDMVLDLSRFLRLSLSKGRETFTLKETVEHLQYYLRIQQRRFPDRLDVVFRIDEASEPVPILKLIVQPIVENAIVHGLEETSGKIVLTVSAAVADGDLHLEVRDNGAGISADRLEYIRSRLDDADTAFFRDGDLPDDLFGLRNVKARLHLYYGPRAQLLLASAEGEGTTVRVLIPLEVR